MIEQNQDGRRPMSECILLTLRGSHEDREVLKRSAARQGISMNAYVRKKLGMTRRVTRGYRQRVAAMRVAAAQQLGRVVDDRGVMEWGNDRGLTPIPDSRDSIERQTEWENCFEEVTCGDPPDAAA